MWHYLEIVEGTRRKRSSLDELGVICCFVMELVSYDGCGAVGK